MLKIEKKRLKRIFEGMKSRTIMVIGDLMLDEYIWGNVDRISPEAPVPVVEVQKELFKLGGAGNVANNLINLGATVRIAAIMGSDRHADILLGILKDLNIPTDYMLPDPMRGTTVKTRIIAHTQQVARIDKENRSLISDALRNGIISSLKDSIHTIDAIIISDYGKGVVSKKLIRDVVATAKAEKVPICVDPKERNFPFYRNVNVITPNIRELSFGAGIKIEENSHIDEAAQKVKSLLGCDMVLVTRGEHGMRLFAQDGKSTDIPTNAKAVFDVTGAGDTVISCFTLSLASGATPLEAAIIANVAAGLVVAEVGAASVPWGRLLEVCMEEVCG
ncbi:MAG: D-glycero-beta-D-manno-heptose-7-phosphate kinase [Desulfomonilia bacterium]